MFKGKQLFGFKSVISWQILTGLDLLESEVIKYIFSNTDIIYRFESHNNYYTVHKWQGS